jgi:hypothetical protein
LLSTGLMIGAEGAMLSTYGRIGVGVVFPAGSLVVPGPVGAGSVGLISVQVTVPVDVAGVGTQVVPGIVTVSPGVTPVQVTVLSRLTLQVGAVGGVVSFTYGIGTGVELPAGSLIVAIGLLGNVPGVVSVQTTIPVAVAGLGVQVVPGRVIVAPGSTLVQVTITAVVPLDGLGVAVHVGAVGATLSIVITTGNAGETFPAGSVAKAFKGLAPIGSGVVGVIDQVPSGRTVVVPITVPAAFLIVIVSPATPVPVIVGVVSLVGLVAETGLPSTVVITGASGATLSTTTVVGADTLP